MMGIEPVTETVAGQIVAMGGGGFSMEPDNPLLDEFVLSLAGKQTPRVCFIPTASADSAAYIVRFYRAFSGRAIPTDLTIFDTHSLPRQPTDTAQIAGILEQQDIIYVGGGNTANLLSIWRSHGIDKVLANAWARGTILAGISAGMICWFRDGLTDSFGQLQSLGDGLGLLGASACPHYDEDGRRSAYHEAISKGLIGGYAADNGAALHFRGISLAEAISSRPNAGAYHVELIDERIHETRIETRFLGSR